MKFHRRLANRIAALAAPTIPADIAAARAYNDRLKTWSADEIAALQLQKVAAAWEDCVKDIPYYQKLVASGSAPKAIRSWDEFRQIPILEKAYFRKNQADFIRVSGPPHHFMQTAGSTGIPMKFGVTADESKPLRVAKLVLWIRNGYEQGSPMLLIWGHSHLLGTGFKRIVKDFVRKGKDRLLNYHRARAYSMTPQDCDRIAQTVIKHRPVGIIGYASALDLFARYSSRYRDQLRKAGVRFVISTAELPPRPDTFDVIRDVLGCSILEELGGVEFGQLAMKQDQQPWEVFPDLNILEIEDKRDEEGHAALVTTLYPRYTPFVRYKQGDMLDGVHRLPHGHVHRFNRLIGRVHDMMTLDDGTSVHSVTLFHCVHQEPKVLNIQMTLYDQGPRLKLVVTEKPDAEFEGRVRHRLKQIHPQLASAPIEYVQDLSTNIAGKRRWFLDERTKK